MTKKNDERQKLLAEVKELRVKLEEAAEVLRVIRDGGVDAVVVSSRLGKQVFLLKGEEHAYRVLIEAMNEGAATLAADGTILYCNNNLVSLVKTSMEKLTGTPFCSLITPSSLPLFEAILRRSLDNGSEKGELTLVAGDGTNVPIHFSASAMKGTGTTMVCVVVTDLSRQKRNEEVVASGKLASAILEQAGEAILVCDETGHIIRASQIAQQLVGIDPTQQHFDELLPLRKDTDGQPFSISETLRGDIQQNVEVMLDRRDGTKSSLLLNSRPLRSTETGVTGSVSTLLDITERKQAEEELKFRAQLLDAATDSIFAYRPGGDLVYANEAAYKLHGYSKEELMAMNRRALTAPESAELLEQMIKEVMDKGEVTFESVHLSKDGRKMPVEAHGRLIKLRGEDFILSVCRDITERKQSEKALTESNRLLKKAMAQMKATEHQVIQQERLQALGQMASGIAHDFNNSLTPILGFSQMLLAHPENLQNTEEVKGYLEMINLAARDAAVVVRRLRDFYRAPERADTFAPMSLNEIVGQAISLTQAKWKDQAQANGITINIETELGDVPPVLGNQAELREALANLILNAVDAMPNGGRITLSTRQEQDHVILAVSDTGTGMTEEVRLRCLEPFFTTKGEKGSGMGLPAVYGTAQRHGGSLEIETEVGKGSTFTIRLPIMMPKRAESDLPEPVASRPHILVVDDQPMVRRLISEYLMADGHTVEAATNGKDALEKFVAGRFDLVVTDRAMPEMSGDQLAVAIKKVAPSMPVILLTGVGDIMQDAKEKTEGVDVILGKPLDLTDLRQAIRSCLTSRKGDEP